MHIGLIVVEEIFWQIATWEFRSAGARQLARLGLVSHRDKVLNRRALRGDLFDDRQERQIEEQARVLGVVRNPGNLIRDEPRLRAWLPSGFSTAQTPEERPGRWIGEADWPGSECEQRDYWLGQNGLLRQPQPECR